MGIFKAEIIKLKIKGWRFNLGPLKLKRETRLKVMRGFGSWARNTVMWLLLCMYVHTQYYVYITCYSVINSYGLISWYWRRPIKGRTFRNFAESHVTFKIYAIIPLLLTARHLAHMRVRTCFLASFYHSYSFIHALQFAELKEEKKNHMIHCSFKSIIID